MLLRLSRISFWLAAVAACVALVAPGGRETLLTATAMAASLLALVLWRSAMHGQRRRGTVPDAQLESEWLDEAALDDAAERLVRHAHAAPSFEAALHATVRVLRSELGIRDATVYAVVAVEASGALLSELIETQPGFRAVAQRVRLDAGPIGRALRLQQAVGEPPGTVAVPVCCGQRAVALIELAGVEGPVPSAALARVLELARRTLSELAPPEGLVPDRAEPMVQAPGESDDGSTIRPPTAAQQGRASGASVICDIAVVSGASRRTQFDLASNAAHAPRRTRAVVQPERASTAMTRLKRSPHR